MATLTLLVSSVGAVSFHNADNDDVAFAQKQISHNTTSIAGQHAKFDSQQPGCCNHGCHAVYHFLGLISAGFNLSEVISHIAQRSSLVLSNIFLLSWRVFKPPRSLS